MSPGKLRMKRTPEEQAARDLRKAQKAARKASKRSHRSKSPSRNKRRRTDAGGKDEVPGWDDEDVPYGPEPEEAGPSRSNHRQKPDWDYIRAQEEQDRFQDKLWSALDDDERLDGVEARFNSYAHIPRRWRGGGMERMDEDRDIDPQFMEDEDYAEWIRVGMWRKKHAAEHAEQVRVQAERAARRKKEEAIREETRRLQKAAEEERHRRRSEKHQLKRQTERESYEINWKVLLEASEGPLVSLSFDDIPWPSFDHTSSTRTLDAEFLTAESVSTFLLFPPSLKGDQEATKSRKEILRETLLRFHPDKFEARVLKRVQGVDHDRVKDAAGKVVRIVNALISEK
ncbi:hypothetical protein NLI96_g7524 [Meripilus lineatus]|uniref:Uncharacterized protein n=1 Tax=Meripilus lineatus TaxID=2056292 RepID=A0AAD5YBZ5_9APHY|nr:hypothetical protein NLI96_g7524 [Physisporinus lineatus]